MPTLNASQMPRVEELRERVRSLLAITGAPVVTSLYLDIDRRRRPRAVDRQRALTHLAQEARAHAHEIGPAAAASVDADLALIAGWLGSQGELSNILGVAFFVSSGKGRFEAFPLSLGIADEVAVGVRADTRQLQATLGASRPYVIALVDRRRARIILCHLGTVAELVDVVDPLPRRHDQGGWSAPSRQHRVDELGRRHLARAADIVAARLSRHPAERLLVGGPEKDVAVFEDELPASLRQPHAERVAIRVGCLDSEVEQAVLEITGRLDREAESAEAAEVLAAVRSGHAVAGAAWTLAAVGYGRARRLIVSSGYRSAGARCPECGMLAVTAGPCARCDGPTAPLADVALEAIADASAAGCEVRVIADEEMPAALFGIAAVLRF